MASAAQARAERGKGPRLTRQVAADIVAGVRTGTAVVACCEYVGISRGTYRNWRMTAAAARAKTPRSRTQYERMCIAFDAQIVQAEADAQMRITMQIASAAGLTRERPKRRRTTQRVVGTNIVVDENGQVSGGTILEVQIVEEELAPDWRAAARFGSVRFPAELGDLAAASEDAAGAAGAPREVSTEALRNALNEARRRAGLDKPRDVIDAQVVEAMAELEPVSVNGTNGHAPPPGDALTLTEQDLPSDEELMDDDGEAPD